MEYPSWIVGWAKRCERLDALGQYEVIDGVKWYPMEDPIKLEWTPLDAHEWVEVLEDINKTAAAAAA
jgi:hypothetical protein